MNSSESVEFGDLTPSQRLLDCLHMDLHFLLACVLRPERFCQKLFVGILLLLLSLFTFFLWLHAFCAIGASDRIYITPPLLNYIVIW